MLMEGMKGEAFPLTYSPVRTSQPWKVRSRTILRLFRTLQGICGVYRSKNGDHQTAKEQNCSGYDLGHIQAKAKRLRTKAYAELVEVTIWQSPKHESENRMECLSK